MSKYYKIYWFTVFFKFISGVFLLINYFFHFNVMFLFKIPLIIGTSSLILLHFKEKLYVGFVTILFFSYLIVSIVLAFYFNNLPSTKTLSHLYTILMAIFGYSFGYHFAKNYTIDIALKVKKYISYLFLGSFVLLLVYFYGHYISGQIEYFGFDSELQLNFSFFLAQGQIGMAIFTFFLVLFSGKRSPLITIVFLLFVYGLKKINFKRARNVFLATILLLSLTFVFYYGYIQGFFWRFENVVNVNIEDEESFYNATSGRSAEFIGLFNHMNSVPLRWFLGSGLGGSYYIDIIRGDYQERYQHYTHLSLLSFVFLFGIPFVVLLLIYIFFILYKNFKYINNKYYLALISTFIGTFFGAGMLIDSIFWVLLGINAFIYKAKPNSLILKY
jgi:hypothetical protein